MPYANSAEVIASRPHAQKLGKLAKSKPLAREQLGPTSLLDYLENDWLPELDTQVKASTYASVESHVRLHIGPAIGHINIEQLTRRDLTQFYANLLKKPASGRRRPLSRTSVQRVHATLHWALEGLVQSGRLSSNPARGIRQKRRKWETYEFRIWTVRELNRFLTQNKTDPLFALWRLLAMTGMRRGEALGLKWNDLRNTSKTVAIRRAITLVGGRIVLSSPKSGQGRGIALDRETVATLGRYRRSQSIARRVAKLPAIQPYDWIFAGPDGNPIRPDYVSKQFRRHVAQMNVPDIRLHDLRHTHASHLILSGANIKAVQERLGHADIVLTLNIYAHLLPTTQREAVTELERFYRRAIS